MKLKYFLLLFITLTSCKEDISNEKFRNENYVFNQVNGKAGKWKKINPELEIKLYKSNSMVSVESLQKEIKQLKKRPLKSERLGLSRTN